MKLIDLFDIHVGKLRNSPEGNSLPTITASDIPAHGFMSKPMKEIPSSEPPALAASETAGSIIYPFDIIFDPVSFKAGLVAWRGVSAYIAKTNLLILRYRSNVCESLNLVSGVFFQDYPEGYTFVEQSNPHSKKIIEVFMYLRSSKGQCQIANEASGKAIKKISVPKLASLDIPLTDELQTEKAVNSFYEEIEIHKRLYQIHNIFGTVDSIQPPPNTVCSFCKKHLATEYVARWDTWVMKSWGEPACSQCAPLNKQTVLT
jgi:hypothetical protein